MARYELDIYAIKQRIPEIMGMDLEWKRDGWQGGYYMNGEKHPYRKDKLKVRVWKNEKGSMLWVHEEGGESMSLVNWLQRYGGAGDWKDAMDILRGNSTPKRELLEYIRPKEGRYVSADMIELYEIYDLHSNNLFNWMCRLFGEEKTRECWKRYNVTSDERNDTCFWYVNNEGRICHDKIVRYQWDGHRSKNFGGFRRFKTSDGYSERCAFGSHLIESDDEIVNIVESEKTAIMAYLAYGGIWIAVGGKGQLRDVDDRTRLWPDIDAAEAWAEKGNVVAWWEGEEVGEKWDIGDLIDSKIKKGEMKIL